MRYNKKIASIIGQDIAEHEILYTIHRKQFSIFEVIGKRGAGKRTLSNRIADIWIKQNEGVVYYLNSSYQKIPEDFSTFKTLILQNNSAKKTLINIFCESLKDIPMVGNSLSIVASEIAKCKNENEELPDKYTYNEQYIFSEIDKNSNNRPILFICNEIELWDLKSQRALSALIEHEKTITNKKICFIFNVEHIIESIKGDCVQKKYISEITFSNLAEVVNQINPKIDLNREQLKQLSDLTAGNLELIQDSIDLFDNNEIVIGKNMYNIIELRILNDSAYSEDVLKLLKQTAFIGETVDSQLLKIFSEIDHLAYENVLKEAIRLSYLKESNNTISFLQQLIYIILKDFYHKDNMYYRHLLKCINILYPSRYDLQIQYLYRGNLSQEADKMFFIYLISYYRENNVEYFLDSIKRERLQKNSYYKIYEQIDCAYKYYKQKKYTEAEDILNSVYCSDISFRFEKDYLLSLIVTNKYYTFNEFSERIDALNTYITEDFKNTYPEMYFRTLMILAEFYAETDSIVELKKNLQEIFKCFSKYSNTDKQMQCYEYCFKMKTNAFYKVEIAERYTKSSYEYFKKPENMQYYLSKYYIASLNHSANEIILSNFQEAYEILLETYNIIRNQPTLKNIHEEILINNLAISGYYSKHFSAKECAENIETILSSLQDPADKLLLMNNEAVFLALEGKFAEALTICSSLYMQIDNFDDIDPYYKYFVFNNHAILSWLTKKDNTLDILEEISVLKPLPQDQAYFNARTKFLIKYIKNNQPDSTISNPEWNNILYEQNSNVVGKAWKYWSSLLLLSELQIWSDY